MVDLPMAILKKKDSAHPSHHIDLRTIEMFYQCAFAEGSTTARANINSLTNDRKNIKTSFTPGTFVSI
jgi:hypothetical protein